LVIALSVEKKKCGWDRGMAVCDYFSQTVVAEVAEVSVASDYSVRVHRVVCAVDCGLVVHPTIAETQIEGAVVMGLTAALKREITVGVMMSTCGGSSLWLSPKG